MMHSTYTSSIVSLRTSFSFNGYSYYSNERCPSTCICSSCSISLNSSRLAVPINPNLSYGLRQSTLIQLPPSRRLILGSGDRPCFRSPVCNVGHHCCRESSCVHHYNVDRFVERNCKEDCCVKDRSVSGNQIKSRMMGRRNYRCSVLGDADVGAMISLLADDSNDECLDVKGRRRGLVEEERDVHNEHSVSGIEENVDQVRVQLSEEAHMKREEMRDFSREEDLRLRRRESSSSYITTSELGDFESDIGAQIKDRGFDGEASINHEKGPRKAGNSSTEWNCRKKSEKKLTAGSAQETESKKVSLVGQRQSHLSYAHDGNSMKASSWKKKLNYQEGESSSSVSFHEQSTCHLETENRVCGYLNCDTEREHLMQDIRNEVQSTINSQRISNEEESVMVVAKSAQGTGCKYCIQCGGMMQQIEKRTGFEQHSELSETQDDANVKLSLQTQSESRLTEESASLQNSVAEASSAHTKFESRTRMQEESSTSLQASAKEENGLHHQMVHVVTGEINNERKSEQYCEVVDSHRSGYAENDSRLQQQPETQMKNLEEYSTSLVSSQEIKGLQEESSYINIKGIESNKQSQAGLYASKVHSTNAEVNHQTISEQQIYSEQIFSTLKVKSEEELVEKHHQINEASVKSELRTETKGHILPVGLTGSSSGDMIVAQPLAMLDSQTDIEQISEGEVKSDLQISVVSPLYKFAEERPSYGELSISSIDNDHGSVTEIGTNLVYIQPQSRPESSSVEENSCGRKSFREHSPDDAVDSAKHKESMHIFGELVEKMTNEVSTSDSLTEKKLSEENLQQQNEEYKLKGPNQPDSVKISLQKQVPRGSSSGSGTNRSLDEMLGVKNHLPQNSAEKESLEGAASDDGVAKRTGKSLWSILAGIFRIRRGSRSETETSPSKSGGRNSSNESASNETWFSKYERDDTTGDSLVEKQQMSVPRKPTVSDEIPLGRNATKSWKGALGVVNSDEKIGHIGVGISSSSNALQTGLLLGVVSAGANTNLNISQPMPQLNPSLDLSRKPSRRLRRSHTSEKIEEVSQNERLVSSAGQTGVSASERRDGKLREQQLRHTDQVLQETFNKWENAIRHDKEQHKIDEFFMSEALIEAKKAADSWEVPIGAVLVQDGKIIARGYNLVEELRDATAHAEMICIREASSVLRSWRLSETTLYVTLEPCPMCAGAILQARIGTLVWGAPNKLLGADGSWIRLLPNTEGEDRPEVAHKPAAPVHPFHPKMKIRRGVLESECAEIMQQFFQLRRKKEEKSSEEMSQTSCLPIPQDPPRLLHKMHNILNIMLCL